MELLGPGAELLALEVTDDALQPPPCFLGSSQGLLRLRQFGLQDARPHRGEQRRSWAISSMDQPAVPCPARTQSCAALTRQAADAEPARDAPGANPALEQGRKHRRRHPHHAAAKPGPDELRALQPLMHQHQSGAIPDQNLDPIGPFGPEDDGGTTVGSRPSTSCSPPPAHQGHDGSRPDVSPRRSSDRNSARSSRRPHRTDHLRQLLDLDRRSDYRIANHDLNLRRRRFRWLWRQPGRQRVIHQQRREQRLRALRKDQLSQTKAPPPIIHLRACRSVLSSDHRNLRSRHQALRRYPRPFALRAKPPPPSDPRQPQVGRRSQVSRRPIGRPFARLLPSRSSANRRMLPHAAHEPHEGTGVALTYCLQQGKPTITPEFVCSPVASTRFRSRPALPVSATCSVISTCCRINTNRSRFPRPSQRSDPSLHRRDPRWILLLRPRMRPIGQAGRDGGDPAPGLAGAPSWSVLLLLKTAPSSPFRFREIRLRTPGTRSPTSPIDRKRAMRLRFWIRTFVDIGGAVSRHCVSFLYAH